MEITEQSKIPKLKVLLLGAPLVTNNNEPVIINRREQRAGLFYLGGNLTPVSRSEVCDLFWPKDNEKLARKKLREGLSRLRTCLKDPECIISYNDTLVLNAERIYSDYWEYQTLVPPLLSSSEFQSVDRLPDWLYGELCKVMHLCRGNQFLKGMSLPGPSGFENWLAYSNHTFTMSRERILQRLADHSITIGNLDEALLWLEQWVEADPLNADANFLLLNCLREKGFAKKVRDHLLVLERIYHTNHYPEMPQILAEFKERLTSHALESSLHGNPVGWPTTDLNAPPFIGREELLKKLNQAFLRKGCVFLSGDAGVGKTRLVEEFYTRLDYKPFMVFCVARGMVADSPFTPLVEGLRTLLSVEIWRELPPLVRDELRGFFPEMELETQDKLPLNSSRSDPNTTQQIHHGFTCLISSLLRDKPLLLVVDISHKCDKATLGLLDELIHSGFINQHGLMILISRNKNHNLDLDVFLHREMMDAKLEWIDVPSLSLEETSQLIARITGRLPEEQFVRELLQKTGGNPFFLVETLKTNKPGSRSLAGGSANNQYPLPETLHILIQEKINLLSPCEQKVLIDAAILGYSFPTRVLEEMAALQPGEWVNTMERLQQVSFLLADDSQTDCHFAQGQVREVVLQNLSQVRKRHLHLVAVKALQKIQGDVEEMAALSAEHFYAANEMKKAFDYWCIAARYAQKNNLHKEAYTAYQNAFSIWADLSAEKNPALLTRLIYAWGDYAYDLNDDHTCEVIFSEGLRQGELFTDALLIGTALSGLGRVAEMRGNIEEGIDLNQRALSFFVKSAARAEIIEIHARLGVLYELKADYILAYDILTKGCSIKPDQTDENEISAVVNVKTQLSLLLNMMGEPNRAETIAEDAVNDSLLLYRQSAKVQAYTVLAISQFYASKYNQSIRNAQMVYPLACKLRLVWWSTLLDLTLARCYLEKGFLDECWYHVHRAIDDIDARTIWPLGIQSNSILGGIYRVLGNLPMAVEQFRVGAVMPMLDFPSLENGFFLGMTLCHQGQHVEGIALLAQVAENANHRSLGAISHLANSLLATWQIPDLNVDGFLEHTKSFHEEIVKNGYQLAAQNYAMVTARMAAQSGDLPCLYRICNEVVQKSEQTENRWIEMVARVQLIKNQLTDGMEKKRHMERITVLLNEIAAHATQKPVAALFSKYRKNIARLV